MLCFPVGGPRCCDGCHSREAADLNPAGRGRTRGVWLRPKGGGTHCAFIHAPGQIFQIMIRRRARSRSVRPCWVMSRREAAQGTSHARTPPLALTASRALPSERGGIHTRVGCRLEQPHQPVHRPRARGADVSRRNAPVPRPHAALRRRLRRVSRSRLSRLRLYWALVVRRFSTPVTGSAALREGDGGVAVPSQFSRRLSGPGPSRCCGSAPTRPRWWRRAGK